MESRKIKKKDIKFCKRCSQVRKYQLYPSEDRIAAINNDGTLWAVKPTYFQGFFLLDRLKELSKSNPELKHDPLIEQILHTNFSNLQLSKNDIISLVMLTHANITQPEFNKLVSRWIKISNHPLTQKRFVHMVYQPMIELIDFLKNNDFTVFIVSGGGVDFVREALSNVYGIPSHQIIGSSIKFRYISETDGSNSRIIRESQLSSFNESEAKPENIQLHIGKVPVLAIGNSDGDLEMLRYTEDNNVSGKSLQILVHHDDSEREFSYDTLAENVIVEAQKRNWVKVSMKHDFRNIYPSHADSG